jgi:molybdate transport system substrate-binding protein
MRIRILSLVLVLLLAMAALPAVAADQKLTAGVAANFIVPFGEIATLFEKQTGIKVEPVFTSSGKLYAQIVSGAPYDVFLSADEERPAKLFKDGLADKPFVYAKGQVVLWSADLKFCSGAKDWTEIARSANVKKIAIANPETAPYGAASMEALKAAGLAETVKDKFVFPQDIGQAFQYASTGSVDAGFCALSSAMSEEGKKGCYLPVQQAPQVVQAACVLVRSTDRKNAERFAAFLLTPEAVQVKEKYGYK